jgi:hypothetical protein
MDDPHRRRSSPESNLTALLPLRDEVSRVLELNSRDRLEALLHAKQPMRLVRSIPDSELYLTVRELGPADALPLLALASAEQLQHLVDLEAWRRDRFDAERAGAWLALLVEAGEPALRRWLRSADDDLLALLAQSWMQVRPIEPEGHDHEDGLVSPDGGYLASPAIPEHQPAVAQVLQLFFRDQHERYLMVLWSAVSELPAELEERTLHWRQSRLEEHGFPPWDEAIQVYAPPRARPQSVVTHRPPLDLDRPLGPGLLRRLPPADALAQAFERMPEESRERLLQELLAVANHLLVADGADTGDPGAHRETLATAAGYVWTALEARNQADPTPVGSILDGTPMLELFRQGHGLAIEIQARARRQRMGGGAPACDRPARARGRGRTARPARTSTVPRPGRRRAAPVPFARGAAIDAGGAGHGRARRADHGRAARARRGEADRRLPCRGERPAALQRVPAHAPRVACDTG